MNIETIYNNIVKLISDSGVWAEIGIDPISKRIEAEVSGDWKHDHLRLECLVGTYLNSNGIHFMADETVTESDGSDWYSSIHYFTMLDVG